MFNLFRRIPAPVVGGLLIALLVLTFFVRSQEESGHDVPLGLSLVRWVSFIAVAVLGLFQVARGLLSADRAPFDPFATRAWPAFFIVTGGLIAIPVLWLVDNEPTGDLVPGAIMLVVGLLLVALFAIYMRKPVRDHGTTVDTFHWDDRNRRRSPKVRYGGSWRLATDPEALYAVSWIEKTNEIYALRYPRLPRWLALPSQGGWPAWVDGSWTVEVLGWAENREVLDHALSGWEEHMDAPDSLTWVRQRLQDAAEATERQRASM